MLKITTEETQASSPENYCIRLTSRWRFAVVFMPLVLGGLGMLFFLQQQDFFPVPQSVRLVVTLLSFAWMALAFLLARKIATGWVIISLDPEGVHLVWSQQFAFAHHPDRTVCWIDIIDYKFEYTRNWRYFEATLKDGTVWRFGQDLNTFRKDGFNAFRNGFIEKVEQYNQLHADNAAQIRRGKTFLETRQAFVLSILAWMLMVAFPIALIILYMNNSRATALVAIMGVVGVVPALLLVYGVYIKRKERNGDE